jgi:hypothetical protein
MGKGFLDGLQVTVLDEDLFTRIVEYLQKQHDKTGKVHFGPWKPPVPGKALLKLMKDIGTELPKDEKHKKKK